MTESANGHENGRDDVFDNNNDTNKYRIHDSLQNILRRRSITPPPEYQCRLDPINHYLRTMANGSTSTLSSSISNASNSTNCSSILTNSSNHSLSSSSTSSSSMFRTHRFIPNIISHQAQKMAQHFRSSNSSHKKDSIGSLKDGKTSNSNNNENQTILSFLFGLSLGSGSGLKRSESVSNINRINHNILLPKNYDLVPNSSSTPKKSADRHLNVTDSSVKYRKHSVNDEIITASTSQMFSNVNTSTSDCKSKTNEHRKSPSAAIDSSQTYSSPKHQLNSKLINNVIGGKQVKQPLPSMDNGQQQPPPLPPKTYRPNGTPTTSISSSSSGSFNNSGRSSIASNASSMSSSSSLTSHSTGSSLSMGQHYRCKDATCGDSGLSSALPSNSSGEFQTSSAIGQSSSISSTSSVGSINGSNKTDESSLVNSKENNDDTITVVANDALATYSQVTLRPKKVRRNHQAIIINNNVVNHSDTISNCNRCSSPPPLPPPDSFCTLNISSSPRCIDSLTTNNNSKESDIPATNSQCYCCCCKQQTSGTVNGGTVGQIRQIRTYRKPNTQTTRNSNENTGSSSTNSIITSKHMPLSLTKSCSSLGSMALNRHCGHHLASNECCKQSNCGRPTLVHSVTMNETSFGSSLIAPPPLPPKRNLHAYMGMVGNYTGLGSELNHHSTIRSTKSMFCGSNVTNLHPHPMQILSQRKLSTETNTTVSSCSISTSFSNSGSSSSPPQSLTGSDRGVAVEDEYQHLPMAPPPPSSAERDLPSPPPILPPRRDKTSGKLAPPPPPIQRSVTISRSKNNLNNGSICHYHCHCQHQNQNFDVCHRSASIGANEDVLPSDYKLESSNQSSPNDQKSEPEQLTLSDNNAKSDDIVNVNEVEMEIVEEITCCPYCSDGTVHTEDECILAQVDVSPDLFTYQSDDGSMGNDNSSKSFGDSNEICGGTIDALLIKAIQASLTAGWWCFCFFKKNILFLLIPFDL